MVKIIPVFLRFHISGITVLLGVLFHLATSVIAFSQDSPPVKSGVKKIEILNADASVVNEYIEKDLNRLLGNVRIKHKEVLMYCDSAYYYKGKNQVKAFSNVHIEQGDTIDLFGDYIFYDGKTEIAVVEGNVELINKETHLYTNKIDYEVNNKIARYNDRGRITNSDNTLTSIIGVYYVSDNIFHFKDSVKIVNPDYVMTADTMDYNTDTEVAFFTGPSKLIGDSINLYCEKGWYDTKNEVTSIWKNAVIDNKVQIIHGDSLFFDDNTGYGDAFGNVVIEDTTNNVIVEGNYAWYYKEPERFMITDRAMFMQISNADTMFLHADTIKAVTLSDTSLNSYKLMRAYYGCRIFSNDLQAKCDSLSYSFQDSVIRFYNKPVIWSEENQLTSDSMAIFTKNQKADRLELYNNAFVASEIDSSRYNQIKGRSLTGYFANNELYKIDVKGNGESIYFLLDGEDVAGVNKTKCANIEAYVDKGNITEIYEFQNPEGIIDPPDLLSPLMYKLEGFQWFGKIRPMKKEDIFNK